MKASESRHCACSCGKKGSYSKQNKENSKNLGEQSKENKRFSE
jgi:hypothetical protein